MLYVDIPTQRDQSSQQAASRRLRVDIFADDASDAACCHEPYRTRKPVEEGTWPIAGRQLRQAAACSDARAHSGPDERRCFLAAPSKQPGCACDARRYPDLPACQQAHESVEVSDRFHLKPLLRAVAFPHTAMVLAVSENAARLIQISADHEPQEVSVPELPKDAADAVDKSTLNNRAPSGEFKVPKARRFGWRNMQGLFMPRYGPSWPVWMCRSPAASEPLASIYRSVNSYHELLAEGLLRTDDRTSMATSPRQQYRSWLAYMPSSWKA